MSRTKPTTDIDIIGNVDPKPEKDLDNYIVSKQQDDYHLKQPNWDSTGVPVEAVFIQIQREHNALSRQLKEMQKNRKVQAEKDESRVDRLYDFQDALRKRLIEVTNFLRDCHEKKKAAKQKLKQQLAIQEELRDKRDHCKRDIRQLKRFKTNLMKFADGYESFERVMQQVIQQRSDVFESVDDCIQRCDALMMVQVEIKKLEDQKLLEIEEMRKQFIEVTNEVALRMLGFKNELSEMQRSYEKVVSDCLKWERVLARDKDVVAHHDRIKEMSIGGMHQIYLLLCKRRSVEPTIPPYSVEPKLDFIKDEVEILTEVFEEYEKRYSKQKGLNNQQENISTHRIIKC